MKFISFASPARVLARRKIFKCFTEPHGRDIAYVLEKTAASKEVIFGNTKYSETEFNNLVKEGAIVQNSEGNYYFNEGYYKKIGIINILPLVSIFDVFRENKILAAFRKNNATNPDNARELRDMEINTAAIRRGKPNFDAMTHYGSIKRIPGTLRFYLDEERYKKQKTRDSIIDICIWGVVIALIVILILLVF